MDVVDDVTKPTIRELIRELATIEDELRGGQLDGADGRDGHHQVLRRREHDLIGELHSR